MRKFKIPLFIIFSLLTSVYFIVSALQVNSGKDRLQKEEEKLAFLKKENEELLSEIEYRKTDEFVINEARKSLNYGFEGEEIIVIPKELEAESLREKAGEKVRAKPKDEAEKIKKEDKKSDYLYNINLWIKVFGF